MIGLRDTLGRRTAHKRPEPRVTPAVEEGVADGIRRTIGLAVGAIVGSAAALGWILWIWLAFASAPSQATGHGPVVMGKAGLVDRTAGALRGEDRGARRRLVMAGSTSRPDIRPPALATTAAALRAPGPAADQPQPLAIAADPERDTPPVPVGGRVARGGLAPSGPGAAGR